MKKLWKHEWKYHVGFLILAILLLFVICSSNDMYWFAGAYDSEYILNELMDELDFYSYNMLYLFLYETIAVLMLLVTVKKGIIFWQENKSCGREFFECLPVTRRERFAFHFCMDSCMIVIPMLVYTIKEYVVMNQHLTAQNIMLPWLRDSYMGMTIVAISYMVLLLGVLYLMDGLFVSGFLKIAGFGGLLLVVNTSLMHLFEKANDVKLVQDLYGFFGLQAVGGNQCLPQILVSQTGDIQYGTQNIFYHAPISPEVFCSGERISYTEDLIKYIQSSGDGYLFRLYDFSHISSYIFYAIGYLLLGCLLIGLAFVFLKNRNLSKMAMYYNGTRFWIASLMAVCMFVMITERNATVGGILINIAAALVVFFILCYFLDENQKNKSVHRKSGQSLTVGNK